MEFENYEDLATKQELELAYKYPITIEQAIIIVTLAENNMELAVKAAELINSGIPYYKVRMMLYRKEIV